MRQGAVAPRGRHWPAGAACAVHGSKLSAEHARGEQPKQDGGGHDIEQAADVVHP